MTNLENHPVYSLEEAITLLEQGHQDIVADLGDGMQARADGVEGRQGLLQRLKSYKALLQLVADKSAGISPGEYEHTPEIHPDVAIILDALREHD